MQDQKLIWQPPPPATAVVKLVFFSDQSLVWLNKRCMSWSIQLVRNSSNLLIIKFRFRSWIYSHFIQYSNERNNNFWELFFEIRNLRTEYNFIFDVVVATPPIIVWSLYNCELRPMVCIEMLEGLNKEESNQTLPVASWHWFLAWLTQAKIYMQNCQNSNKIILKTLINLFVVLLIDIKLGSVLTSI